MTTDAGALLELAERLENRADGLKQTAMNGRDTRLIKLLEQSATAHRQAASQGSAGGEARSARAWQTVPLPATPEMTAAGERIDAEMRAQGFANAEPEAIYYAMLDAAPRHAALSPPVKTGGEVRTTTPVCDLCDAELMCAACGHQQRPGAAQARPDPFMEDYKRDTIAGLIERCAKIAEPWSGFSDADKMGVQDREIIKVREEIAAAIRSLTLPSADREAGK